MLYIHRLIDLDKKTADIESTSLIRDIKHLTPLPIAEQKLFDFLSVYFISDTDRENIRHSIELIEPTIALLTKFHNDKLEDKNISLINLERAINILKSLPRPMTENLKFSTDIARFQQPFIREATYIINTIKNLQTSEEKQSHNEKLKQMFNTILRCDGFVFNSEGIVTEEHTEAIKSLNTSIANGVFFNITMHEKLKNVTFEEVRRRLSINDVEMLEFIARNVEEIKKGVDRAYDNNMRMINLSIILYSYIKWQMSELNK